MSRMVLQHVESLRASGVEWITRVDPPPAAIQLRKKTGAAIVSIGSFEPTHSEPLLSTEEKRQSLQMLNENEIMGCTRCPEFVANRTQTVFGVGNIDCELCFVGEGPGADEDKQGEPFVGAAGKLLNKIIEACNMNRDDVYICNVVKCRPPGNRAPLPDEVANCRNFLERQIEIIRPKFICALGATAAKWLTGTEQPIGRLRGQFHDYKGIPFICTYHPAYLLRNASAKRPVWEDMKMLMAKMGRPVG